MLSLTLVTVGYDSESGAFPKEPLADVPGEIVSVVEHFFYHDGFPRLLLVVQHHAQDERAGTTPKRTGAPKADPRQELTQDEAVLYDRLRTWRRGRAEADGVPPYVILTNREMAQVARRRPKSMTSLRELEGVGQKKAQRFGPDLLKVVAETPAGAQGGARKGDEPA